MHKVGTENAIIIDKFENVIGKQNLRSEVFTMEASTVTNLFDPKLILFDVEAKDSTDLLRKLSARLLEEGYVKESFANAVIEREKIYPTGLPTPGIMVALPHTNPEHVTKPAILVANLKNPVLFKEMGSGINDIATELVFMLAVNDPSSQVDVLKKLMEIFSKEEILIRLKHTSNEAEIIEILEEQMV